MARILLAGVPRSGTSWTGKALSLAASVRYVFEPDGFTKAFAFRTMLEYGETPRVRPGDVGRDYERLWAGAFAGGLAPRGPLGRVGEYAYGRADTSARRRARAAGRATGWLRVARYAARPSRADPIAETVLVKSVQCARSIEWIVERFSPVVVVLQRHPLDTIASWKELGLVLDLREHEALAADASARWGVTGPDMAEATLARQAFAYAVLASALAEAVQRNPSWIVAQHEDLCRDASVELRLLAERVGLRWTEAAATFVRESNREGSGFGHSRVTSEQPNRWRARLAPAEVDLVRSVLADFPLVTFADP